MKRIRRLLYPPAQHAGWLPIASAGLLLLTIAVTLGAWESITPAVPQSSADLSTVGSDAYAKWLNEDVVYIIDDAERAAFLKLKTDDERTHFIEQFWERRNPMPGSAENKFKIEHYRRIAFTNKHFASASVPGWQTDRGHMYILYGPPDEIDSHPKGTPSPWESWGYRQFSNDGQMSFFRFIDSHGTGDFRLAPSNGH
jgi:GWxTD domain-containing protein